MFLVNSCQRYFRCGPHHFEYFTKNYEKYPRDEELNFDFVSILKSYSPTLRKYPKWWGQALSRSYGCFFAEFLGDHSLVRLGLLDLITCVGLRYGFRVFKFRDFSWKRALSHRLPTEAGKLFTSLGFCYLKQSTDFPVHHPREANFKSNNEQYILPSVIPSQNTEVREY